MFHHIAHMVKGIQNQNRPFRWVRNFESGMKGRYLGTWYPVLMNHDTSMSVTPSLPSSSSRCTNLVSRHGLNDRWLPHPPKEGSGGAEGVRYLQESLPGPWKGGTEKEEREIKTRGAQTRVCKCEATKGNNDRTDGLRQRQREQEIKKAAGEKKAAAAAGELPDWAWPSSWWR